MPVLLLSAGPGQCLAGDHAPGDRQGQGSALQETTPLGIGRPGPEDTLAPLSHPLGPVAAPPGAEAEKEALP